MKISLAHGLALAALLTSSASAQVVLLANGTLTGTRAGEGKDLSGLNYTLENGLPANVLGGMGSGFTYAGGNTFLAIPDRGPNATSYDSLVDDTVSYIARFHTLVMPLQPNKGPGLPFTLTPHMIDTTLLHALLPLYYGDGTGLGVASGKPPVNTWLKHYFTGRSDNAVPTLSSQFPLDARLDPESIRVSANGRTVYVSDEYGPYIYEFDRNSGQRLRVFTLPGEAYVAKPLPTGAAEIAGNTSGRTSNKGMEGLAITPDGRTLVGILQAPVIQDVLGGGDAAKKLLRIYTIDIWSGVLTHEYAYALTDGSGVSEITALNNHEFLVDERDGKGLGDGSKAKVKEIFKIDLNGATDIQGMTGTEAYTHAVSKTLFLDLVKVLTANGITTDQIPSKIEGVTIGPDLRYQGAKLHTLWIANDNDFTPDVSGPNQFYVFGFTDADLNGSILVP